MEKNYIKWWNQLNIINKTLLFKKHIKICNDLDSSFENSLFFEDVKFIYEYEKLKIITIEMLN